MLPPQTHRSFKDKVDLLDEALKLHDGDAILAVTLFAQKTLNRNKFLELIVTRPAAARDAIQSLGHLPAGGKSHDLQLIENEIICSLGWQVEEKVL